jgi:ABC-type nitrate/sulfonate/bicarbonate transport system permease component
LLLAGSAVTFLTLLEILVRSGLVRSTFVPAPSSVISALPSGLSTSAAPLATTVGEVALSFVIAMSIGLVLGLLMGTSKYFDDVAGTYAFLLNSTPKVIFLPLMILWFGLGLKSVVVFATLEACIPVALLVTGAVRDLDRDVMRVATSMGATRLQLQSKVIIPASSPAILASAQIALSLCMVGVVLAQMFFGVGGVGALLLDDAYELQIASLYAVALILAAVVVIIFFSVRLLADRYFARWHVRVSAMP